jgi:hypothetical protein
MSDKTTPKRLYSSSSSSASASESLATTTATTPDHSQSRHESEHDTGDSTPSTAFNPAKVSSKLNSLAASARAATEDTPTAPGSDEGHPNDPLLRVYDPTKDENLSIEELLARPRLPRTPFERATMRKIKTELETAANGGASGELGPEVKLSAQALLEQAETVLKKADREKHMRLIRGMAKDLKTTTYMERQ